MTEKRFVTWRNTKVDNAITCMEAIRKAQALVNTDGGRVYVLEVLYVVERSTPFVEVKAF